MKAIGYFLLLFGFLLTVGGVTFEAIAMMGFGCALVWGGHAIGKK